MHLAGSSVASHAAAAVAVLNLTVVLTPLRNQAKHPLAWVEAERREQKDSAEDHYVVSTV
jgi:hypothetical protein